MREISKMTLKFNPKMSIMLNKKAKSLPQQTKSRLFKKSNVSSLTNKEQSLFLNKQGLVSFNSPFLPWQELKKYLGKNGILQNAIIIIIFLKRKIENCQTVSSLFDKQKLVSQQMLLYTKPKIFQTYSNKTPKNKMSY